ncbi:MAG: hypothetical protein ACR2IV_22680 [Bryobacteraceae bacterium]
MNARVRQQATEPGGLLKRLIFWEFPRASWRYDVGVGVILLFIFATPREWFRDQPKASSIILMSSLHRSERVFIQTELLEDVPDKARPAQAEALIRKRTGRTGKSWHVVRVEPIRDDAEQEIKGFIAYTAP